MRPIDFKGQGSKVKVMMGIIVKCGVRGEAMLCVVWGMSKMLGVDTCTYIYRTGIFMQPYSAWSVC